jgi:hypothetical protein
MKIETLQTMNNFLTVLTMLDIVSLDVGSDVYWIFRKYKRSYK